MKRRDWHVADADAGADADDDVIVLVVVLVLVFLFPSSPLVLMWRGEQQAKTRPKTHKKY